MKTFICLTIERDNLICYLFLEKNSCFEKEKKLFQNCKCPIFVSLQFLVHFVIRFVSETFFLFNPTRWQFLTITLIITIWFILLFETILWGTGLFVDAHGLKIQGEGQGGFCQILGGRVYRGCENLGGRVHLFGVLLHFY